MNELKVFNNAEFGQIRTVEIEGKIYFVGIDVARALGYSNPSKAVIQHCKGVTKMGIPSQGGKQETNCIPEGDLYRLITHSELPSAEQFESWVFDEVLPSIRKTGSYEIPKKEKEDKPKQQSLSAYNAAAKIVKETYKDAGVNPMFIAVALSNLYKNGAGIDFGIPLITDKEDMPKLYDCTEIAEELGVMSTGGLPHNKAVSAIIKKLHIEESQIVTTPFSKNGHSDVTVKFKPSILEDVKLWLAENNYPRKIPYVGSKGSQSFYKVVYRDEV